MLWPRFYPLTSMLDVALTRTPPVIAQHLLEAVSGPDGAAVFAHLPLGDPDGALMGPQTGREYAVVAQAAGRRKVEQTVVFAADGTLQIKLVRGTKTNVVGRVVDAGGQPIAGATVRPSSGAVPPTTCGPDGTFRLAGLDVANGRIVVDVSAPGYAPRSDFVEVAEQAGDVEHTFVLAIAARLGGIIVDQFGVPVVGARLWCSGDLQRTDAAGRFAFTVGSDEIGGLIVSPPDDGGAWAAMTTLDVGPGEHRIVHRRLAAARASLQLELFDRATGQRLEPTAASAEMADAEPEYRKLSVAGGVVSSDALAVGTWCVRVATRQGHVGVRNFELLAGAPLATERWELEPAASVLCHIELPAGGALPEDLQVRCESGGVFGLEAAGGRVLGYDGLLLVAGGPAQFRIRGVVPGPLRITATGASLVGSLQLQVRSGDVLEGTLRLDAGASVQLRASVVANVVASEITFTAVEGGSRFVRWLPRLRDPVNETIALPPGRWRCEVRTLVHGGPGQSSARELLVLAGATAEFAFD